MGVPISDERLMVGIDFEYIDSLDEMQEEMIQKTVAQQMAKLQTYKILRSQGLSIPPDLKAEIEGGAPGEAPPGGSPGGGDMMGMGGGGPGPMGVGAPGPGGGGTVMPPPPGGGPGPGGAFNRGTPTGVLDTGPPGGGPAGGPGAAPQISYDRMRGMPAPLAAAIISSSVSITEQMQFGLLDDEAIDARIHQAGAVLADIEFGKKMRRTAREQKKLRAYEVEDSDLLKLSTTEKVVIDKVPPRVRRDILNAP